VNPGSVLVGFQDLQYDGDSYTRYLYRTALRVRHSCGHGHDHLVNRAGTETVAELALLSFSRVEQHDPRRFPNTGEVLERKPTYLGLDWRASREGYNE